MRSSIRRALALLAFSLLPACLPTIRVPSEPVSIAAPEGGLSRVTQAGWFDVLVPGTPKVTNPSVKGPDGAPGTAKMVSASNGALSVIVAYFEAPYGFTDPPEAVLDAMWQANGSDMVETGPAARIPEPLRAERSAPIRLRAHTSINPMARELTGMARGVVTPTRVVFAMVLRDERFPPPPELDRVVASLHITAK